MQTGVMAMRKGMMDRNDRKALYNGFVAGFFGVGCIFAPKSMADSEKYEISVSHAWSEVGRAFSEIMTKENVRRGKEPRRLKERTRPKTAA